MARERSRPARSPKHARAQSALTNHGWPSVCAHTVSSASAVNACPRLFGVLGDQGAHLRLGEVPQAQRLGPDVERAAAGDDRLLGARVDAVVAHVAHPAQHHALGKATRAPDVAGPELTQHRDQGIADQRVDLVDQQHQGLRVGLAPAGQRGSEGAVAESREDIGPDPVQKSVALEERTVAHLAEDDAHRALHVFAHRLGRFDVHVHAAVVTRAAGLEQVPQREQGGGLARLARRVQHEVALLGDQRQELGEVHPFERRDAVVLARDDGAFGVEEAHGGQYVIRTPATLGGSEHPRDHFPCVLVAAFIMKNAGLVIIVS